MVDQSPLEALRLALGGAARAMAHEPEVELSYSADAPSMLGKTLKVPMPARSLPAEQVAEARGFADGYALKLRHHNAAVHNRAAPGDAVARAVFDSVEQARIEAIGGRGMEGVRQNLNSALEMRLRSDPLARARTRDEVPLSTAVALIARERLTGQAPPASAAPGLAMVRDWIEEKAGKDLDSLALAIDDQAAFAKLATRLLEDLELIDGEVEPTDEDGDNDQGEGQDQDQGEDEQDSEDDQGGGS
ncbi:MAG: cobaltochelatase subunit CobT, partial [Sphingomonadaceae bacterium]